MPPRSPPSPTAAASTRQTQSTSVRKRAASQLYKPPVVGLSSVVHVPLALALALALAVGLTPGVTVCVAIVLAILGQVEPKLLGSAPMLLKLMLCTNAVPPGS